MFEQLGNWHRSAWVVVSLHAIGVSMPYWGNGSRVRMVRVVSRVDGLRDRLVRAMLVKILDALIEFFRVYKSLDALYLERNGRLERDVESKRI